MSSLQVPQRFLDNPTYKNWFYTILFGILSWILSLVGVAETNMREIPLLICLIHVRKPVYVFALSLFTLFNTPDGVPLWAVYGVHLVPLMIAWFCFQQVEQKKMPNLLVGLYALLITVGYYVLAILPLVALAIDAFTPVHDSFVTTYLALIRLSFFEITSSTLVVSFYLMQYEIRKALLHSNENLSNEVEKRTFELTSANNELVSLNEELTASNESIRDLNENLEQMVKERTNKINDQLKQLSKYAHMNSHEVRAPLARMLGLMQLIKHNNTSDDQKAQLIDLLQDASNELDTIIKLMNRLLEQEIDERS